MGFSVLRLLRWGVVFGGVGMAVMWLVYFVIGFVLALDALSVGVWYTASRAYVRDVFGGEAYAFVILLVAAESLAFTLSPVAGVLGDVYGRVRVALLGVLRAPIAVLMAFVDPTFIPVLAFLSSLLSVLFYTNVLGILLGLIRGSGRLYGLITIAAPLGYGVGSIIPGLLEPVGGYKLVFVFLGFVGGLAPLMLLLAPSNPGGGGSTLGVVVRTFKTIPLSLILAIILGNLALTLYWNVMSIKLYEVTGSLLAFGFIGGFLTTILSTMARPLAGVVVDRFKADLALALVLLAYAIYNTILFYTTGLAFILLWLIPLYPFRDVAQTMALSRRVDQSLQASVAGLLNMLWGLASLAYVVAYAHGVGLVEAFYIQLVLLVIASTLLIRLALE
jgi:MFS family permease